MTIKQFVLLKVKPDDYYAARFERWDARVRSLVSCPFHNDGSNPNLAISLKHGGARCHSAQCAKAIGNIVHFESELRQIKESIAAKKLYREFIRPVVDGKKLSEYRAQLACRSERILQIKREMGLSYSSIRRFQLGFCAESSRITIPIYDQWGQCINVRFYRLPSDRNGSDTSKIYNLKGFGGTDSFPNSEISTFVDKLPIFIMASEKEAMLAIQDGFCALSSTSGEGNWSEDSNDALRGRTCFIIRDLDKAGEIAAEKLKSQIATVAKQTNILILPFRQKRKDWKDYADWRLREKHTAQELMLLAKKYKTVRTDDVDSSDSIVEGVTEKEKIDFPTVPDFADDKLWDIASISSRSELLNKRIKSQGVVAAKSTNTYSIPWKFAVSVRKRPAFEFKLPLGRELLRFIRSNDHQIVQAIQRLVGSASAEVEPMAYLTATEVEVIPTAVIDQDVPYVVQRCYYFGERIEANVPYYLEIIPTSEIRTQETIGIITTISPVSKSIDRFDFTPENLANLSFFQPTEGEDEWDKLVSVATQVTYRYTHVYNRLDWTLAALLTWASPIGFKFPSDNELQRGWINTLALGDTETGKSKVCIALRKLFNCGNFVSGENCTFVGLVGGAVKMGSGQLMLRWGRIPLSDKQLVVLEELSGLSVEEIANMSDVRSSGIARLDKGGINSETNSRTRLLCLSNARATRKSVSQYLFGVHAVQELIGHGEDIARFDLITTLTDKEVPIEVINASKFATIANDNLIAPDQFQKLIHFIWALTPEQIKFDDTAYEECLNQTKRLSAIYHPSIPIFKGGSGRYKLGRIAAAIACFQFSWGKGKVAVTVGHVKAAARLLELIYRKPSLGYFEYSTQMFDREKVKDEVLLRKSFRSKIPKSTLAKVIETLIHATRFTRDELCAVGSLTIMHADQLIGVMYRERALRKGEANVWEITPPGKIFLEQFLSKLQ